MPVQTLYLGLVIAAFTVFAVVLMGAALWTNGGKSTKS
jgi:hypothetical protein